jgi:hypothetical protein
MVDHNQGDQIGQIFVYWAIIFSRQFMEIPEGAKLFVVLFSTEKVLHQL